MAGFISQKLIKNVKIKKYIRGRQCNWASMHCILEGIRPAESAKPETRSSLTMHGMGHR
jgi:hypothetical protein